MRDTGLCDQLADAVHGSRVKPFAGVVGLRLETDADVLDGSGEEGVGETGEGARGVELGVGEGGVERVAQQVGGFETPAGFVESAELDGDLEGG